MTAAALFGIPSRPSRWPGTRPKNRTGRRCSPPASAQTPRWLVEKACSSSLRRIRTRKPELAGQRIQVRERRGRLSRDETKRPGRLPGSIRKAPARKLPGLLGRGRSFGEEDSGLVQALEPLPGNGFIAVTLLGPLVEPVRIYHPCAHSPRHFNQPRLKALPFGAGHFDIRV